MAINRRGGVYRSDTSIGEGITAIDSAIDQAEAAQLAAEQARDAALVAQTAAETAETNAELAETNAETAQLAAEAARDLALGYASDADADRIAAEAAKIAAENARDAAQLAKTNAETAETNAETAQGLAEAARDAAQLAYDQFDDRYLGSKTTNPTLDNDGNALIVGALYFNSASNEMRIWNGSAWLSMAADASIIDFQQAGTGAVVRTAQDKMREFVSVKDFGAVGDGVVDDTASIQAALSFITSQTTADVTTSGALSTSYSGTSPRLFFPKGVYKITGGLQLGGYLEVFGDSAIIKQYTDTADIFVCEAYQIKIVGIQFVGGRHHLNFYNQNINSTMVALESCQFFLSRSYAINSYSSHATFTHLSTDLSIYKCRFIACNKVLNNCCDHAMLDACWVQVSKDNFAASSAAFLNKGASATDVDAFTRLHIRDTFMIPDIGEEGVDRVDYARWIDNYGSFTATHTRFGGEYGGMSILWHYGAPLTSMPWVTTEAIFKECALFAGPDSRSDSCVVGIQGQVPNRIVIRNCTGTAGRPLVANLSSTNITAYMTDFETASGRKAYDYFKIDIADVTHDINTYAGRSIIPDDLYKYAVKGKQTRVRRAATQSIANGFGNNLVSFDTVEFDNVGAFETANPTRIVMPKGCHKMRISVAIQMATDGAAKIIAATIVDSGITRISGDTSLRGINADTDRLCIFADVEGAPGSYWHVNVQHNAAAALGLLDCRVSITPLDYVG